MTTIAWIFMLSALIFAVGDWIAVWRKDKALEYICKPMIPVGLILVAASIDPSESARRDLFVMALFLSLAGDIFLMLPERFFVAGLGSFLVAHIAYIAGFWAGDVSVPAAAVGLVLVGVGAGLLGRKIVESVRAGRHSEVVVPVVLYMVVISVMVVSAAGSLNAWAIAGAVLFFASDALIAWNRFVAPLGWGPVTVIVTYHLAQAALVVSLI